MASRLLSCIVTVALLGFLAPCQAAHAQAQQADSARAGGEHDSKRERRFRLATSYLQAGRYEQALPLLKDLHAKHPGSYRYYNRLKTTYERLKRYGEAIALVKKRMAGRGQTPTLMAEKARLLYQRGDEAGARHTWDAAIALAPEQKRTYHTVTQSMLDARLFTDAIGLLQQARRALSNPKLFRSELAYLYSATGQHDRAAEEYLHLLKNSDGRFRFVQRRLSPFLDQKDALQRSIEAVRRAIERAPRQAAYRRLAAWLYLEAGRYDDALAAYRAFDRRAGRRGRALFTFAQAAADGGAFAPARSAFEAILRHHPDAPVAPKALRALGRMQEQWAETLAATSSKQEGDPQAHYTAALDAYQMFLERYPEHEAYPEILRRVGHLQLDVLHHLDDAEETLREVAGRYPKTHAADEARLDLGRLQILQGNLEAAQKIFTHMLEQRPPNAPAGEARYELALIHFYRGAFDAALEAANTGFQHLETEAANDALALAALIRGNRGPDSTNAALKNYARARLLHRRHKLDAALQTLNAWLEAHGRHSLADDVRYLRAKALRAQDRLKAARKAFAEIPLMYANSPLADRSLIALAHLQEQQGAIEAAVQTYNRLLKRYPGSLLAPEARNRLQALWTPDDRGS